MGLISIAAYTQKTKLKLRSEMKVSAETLKKRQRKKFQEEETDNSVQAQIYQATSKKERKVHKSKIDGNLITLGDLFQILENNV